MYLKAQHIMIGVMICCAFNLKAQNNLISNGSFEDTVFCNIGISTINQIKDWYNPTSNSSFVTSYCHHTSFGSRTGKVCAGAYTYYTFGLPSTEQFNYCADKFTDTLISGKEYCFKMHLKLYDLFKNGSNNLGVFFENAHISYTTTSFLVPAIPIATLQVTITDTIYKSFSFLYTAIGGETDFMIGGYLPYSSANYPLSLPYAQYNSSFFVYDDFSLVPTAINLGNDITVCATGDSLLIGEPNWTETTYKWYANGLLIDTLHGQIKVKPNSTTTYIVQKTTCITTTDTLVITNIGTCPVTLTVVAEQEPIIPNVFTPNGDNVNDVFTFSIVGSMGVSFSIMNRWGNLIQTTNLKTQTTILWDGRTASGMECTNGVYFYTLEYKDSKGDLIKKNGYVTLIK